MFFLLFALQTPVMAGQSGLSLGIEGEVPEQPDSKKPTWHWRKEAGGGGKQTPEMLVPIGYTKNRPNWRNRYYDEQGQVYRQGEGYVVMKTCDCVQPYLLSEYLSLASLSSTFYLVGNVSLVLTGGALSIPAWLVAGILAGRADVKFREALVEYNGMDKDSG